QPLEQPDLGGNNAHDRLGRGRVRPYIQPLDQDLPYVRPQQPGHHRERCLFPGSVRPDEPGEGTRRDLQVDAGYRFLVTELLPQAAHRDTWPAGGRLVAGQPAGRQGVWRPFIAHDLPRPRVIMMAASSLPRNACLVTTAPR